MSMHAKLDDTPYAVYPISVVLIWWCHSALRKVHRTMQGLRIADASTSAKVVNGDMTGAP